jgi:hypothetical protein
MSDNLTTASYDESAAGFAVTTDAVDYAPGTVAKITALNLGVGGSVSFRVGHLDAGPDGIIGTDDDAVAYDLSATAVPWIVTDGGVGDLDGLANGIVLSSWNVNSDAANQAFILTAQAVGPGGDGVIGTADDAVVATATTTFTDAAQLHDFTHQNTETIVSGGVAAIFSTSVNTVGAGTGLIDPFVRISTNDPAEEGVNTDFGQVILDNAAKGGTNFVHALRLTDLPINIDPVTGIAYYRFELDINQLNADDKQNLSLDAVQIWQASVGNLSNYQSGPTPDQGTGTLVGATLKYNLDAGGDKFIGLNGELQSGSGNTVDMSLLVPVSAFDPTLQFVYLYSAFGFQPGTFNGSSWTANDGFEEWDRQVAQVIDGHKFEDLNANHVWNQPGEPALNGWTVYIDVNNNNVRDAGEPFTVTGITDLNGDGDTTDANEIGYYRFFVTPGTYTIREELQAGWTQTAPNNAQGEFSVTLAAGQSAHNLDFGNVHTATKTGTKYLDSDADGVRDDGEQGLANWIIYAYRDNGTVAGKLDAGDTLLASTTTNGSGAYSFSNLLPGSYLFLEGKQAGWFESPDDDTTSINTVDPTKGEFGYAVTLTSGQTDSGNDFGNFQQATKTGTKFNDLDGDGVRDPGEPGLAGWVIHLAGTDGQGHAVNVSTTTDASGNYSFTVNPGVYTVSEDQKAGWIQSYPDIPGDGDWDITLTSGQTDSGNDFGNFQAATKTGTKFNDLDGDGVRDAGEPGLAGWVIHLAGTDGQGHPVNVSTTTDASGNYSFTVNPGVYTVSEDQKAGWIQSFPDIPGDGDWDITLTSGQTDSGNDFGNFANGSIHGIKFEDLDADGLFDGSDTPMSGVTIRLTGDTDGDGDSDTVDFVTGADGQFHFVNLHPGVYTLTELFSGTDNWVATVDHGDADTVGDNTTTATVLSGQELVWHAGAAGSINPPQHEVLAGQVVNGDAYQLMFGNHHVGAVGLTPGFWYNHLYVWDGVDNNGPKDGQGRFLADKLTADGVIAEPEILDLLPGPNGPMPPLFDVDGDGKKDLLFEGGGKRLIIEWDDAQEIVGSSNGTGGDKLGDFVRYAVTTLLNDVGVPDFDAPNDLIGDIADWLIQYGPTTTKPGVTGNILRYNNLIEPNNGNAQNGPKDGFGVTIKASSAAWQTGDADTPSGAEIFAAMNALTDGTSSNMIVSSNESYVMTALNQGSYFGLLASTLNTPDGYTKLV